MSYTETHTGKIKVITRNTKDTIEYINKHLSEYWHVKISTGGRIWIDETDKFDEDYSYKEFPFSVIKVRKQWWLIEYVKHKGFAENENLEEMAWNENDKPFDFICQFYNGSTCLSEVIADMLEERSLLHKKT